MADVTSSIVAALQQSLSAHSASMREATTYLGGLEQTPGFGILLLRVVDNGSIDLSVRLAAAALFKNYVKRNWSDEGSISAGDRDAVKGNLVKLMIASPPAIQRQISEALGIISNNDFPDAWPRLLPELVEQLQGAAEVTTMVGILETAASVFERFRGTYDTDDVRGVVVIAMQHFGVHLPAILSMLDGRLQALGGGAQKAALAPVLHAIKVCMQIFYLLSTVDLPEVFEDNLEKLMGYCHRYLDLKLPGVQAAAEDDQPGPVESLHAAVLDVVGLYNDKYDEDFAPFLQTFVQDTWGLLAGTPRPVLLSSALDNVVSSALRFLTSVASMLGNAKLFEQEASMRAVLEGVVLPSIRLRAYDVELFEDNPPDFIRGDIEGSDSETRRRSATELVRALTKNLNAQVTPMCSMFADQLLATYGSDKARHEVDKDAAVALVMAVAVKSATTSAGATATNELYNLLDFLRTHILPELSAAESIDARPIARASAIKFVANFRTLFGAAELHSLLPLLAPFTKSTNYVVHTYAAGAIEKILQVKDKAADGSMAARVSVDAVAPVATELLSSLFSRMMAPDYPENEYLMRCVLRLVVFSQAKIGGLTGTLVSALTSLVRRVCANPANPTFNHLLFESIAALMKVICRANPEAVGDFQALLFPPFQDVLQKAVVEFFPYVFQLLAELLELRPPPAPGASSLTDPYRSLLGPVLGQSLWTNKGNVPALTELLSAYLLRGGVEIVSGGHLPSVLNIWQKLLMTKTQEQYAFAILGALLEGVPLPALQPHLTVILQMTMSRVQELQAMRVARMFVHAFARASALHGPGVLEGVLAGFGPGVYASVVEKVVLATAKHVLGDTARQESAVGLTRVLCESALMQDVSNPSVARLWPSLLATVVELCGPPPRDAAAKKVSMAAALGHSAPLFAEEEEEEATDSMYASEYSVAYSRLVHASITDRYAFRHLPPPPTFLAQSLGSLCALRPGVVPQLVAASPVAASVTAACAAAGVVLR